MTQGSTVKGSATETPQRFLYHSKGTDGPLKAHPRLSVQTSSTHDGEAKSGTNGRIRRSPGVMGGDACIRNTRIPVWAIVFLHLNGASWDDVLSAYPALDRDDIQAAIEFARRNPEIIARELVEQLIDEGAETSRQ